MQQLDSTSPSTPDPSQLMREVDYYEQHPDESARGRHLELTQRTSKVVENGLAASEASVEHMRERSNHLSFQPRTFAKVTPPPESPMTTFFKSVTSWFSDFSYTPNTDEPKNVNTAKKELPLIIEGIRNDLNYYVNKRSSLNFIENIVYDGELTNRRIDDVAKKLLMDLKNKQATRILGQEAHINRIKERLRCYQKVNNQLSDSFNVDRKKGYLSKILAHYILAADTRL